MSDQARLPGMGDPRTPVKVFFSRVKDFAMVERDLPMGKDQHAVFDVMAALLGRSLRPFPLDKSRMRANPKQWITSLIDGFPTVEEKTVRFLLSDFCESLKSRMREENRFAVLLLSQDLVFLAHSRGEMALLETENALVTLQRLLDADNVDRFAQFRRLKDGSVELNYFETIQSESFRDFLGIPESDLYYELGEIRIHTQVDGEHCTFQFRKEDFLKKFREGRPGYQLQGNRLSLPSGEYVFDKVFYGRRTFPNAEQFLELLDAESYDLTYYSDAYTELVESLDPLMVRVLDRRDAVVRVEGLKEHVIYAKTNRNFEIVFANRDIHMDPSYSAELATALVQGRQLRIFHAGHPYSAKPFLLGSLEVRNRLELVPELSGFADSIGKMARDLGHGHIASDLLWYSAVTLASDGASGPIKHTLGYIGQALLSSLQSRVPNGTISDDEDDILEYKARDWYEPSSDKMVGKLRSELETKMKDKSLMVMLIGYDEESQRFDLVPANRCKSDAMSRMEEGVNTSLPGVLTRVRALPITASTRLITVLSRRVVVQPPPGTAQPALAVVSANAGSPGNGLRRDSTI
jgi:hypothetical protein